MMIRLLRPDDSVNREDDGAVRFDDLASIFRSRSASTSHWSIRTWLSFLQRGGGVKKRFLRCVNPNSPEHFLYFRAIQGHSGGTHIDPTLQDNVLSTETTSPSTSITLGTLTAYTLSSSLDGLRVVKVSRKRGMRYSSLP